MIASARCARSAGRERPRPRPAAERAVQHRRVRFDARAHQTPAISPVLSAKLFSSSPALLSTVRSRFDSVVCSGSSTCWPPLSAPLRAADQDVRQRIVVVPVAVAHVRAVHEQRVIEQRAVAVGRRRELLDEVREALHVIRLDPHELVDALLVVRVVRQRVERVRHADVVVRAVRALGHHDVRRDAREVRLVRERDQVEHQLDLLVERLAARRSAPRAASMRREIALRRPSRRGARSRARYSGTRRARRGRAAPSSRFAAPSVRSAIRSSRLRVCARDRARARRRVAFAEELREHLARVELHRQRRRRVAERQRRAVVAAGARRARRDSAPSSRTRPRATAAPFPGRSARRSSGRSSSPCSRPSPSVGPHAREPRGRHDRVHGVLRRLVLEVAERGDVALVLLERRQDRAQLEVGARAARRPAIHRPRRTACST